MSLDHTAGLVKQHTLTRDGFLDGRLTLAQPAKGFRAGLDSVLLGAAVSETAAGLLDLGSGVGAAALCAMALRPALTATLIDSDEEMVALAGDNLATNGLAERGRVLALDVTAPGAARSRAGLPTDHFATVIANPPFFDPGRGTTPSRARTAARHMPEQSLERWVKTATAHAAPGGEVIFIHVPQVLRALLDAFDARLGAITVLPLSPHPGEVASRILVRGIKGSRAPLSLLESRPLHETRSQAFMWDFEAIFRGQARLLW